MKTVLAALALAVMASPAAAADSEAVPDFRAMSDAELGEQLAAYREGEHDSCKWDVPFFAEVKRRFGSKVDVDRFDLLVRSFCATDRREDASALRLLKQAERSGIEGGTEGLGLYLAVRLDEDEEAMARFRQAAGSGAFSYLDRQLVFPAIRLLTRAGHERELDALAYGVATGARFEAVNPDFQPWFAQAAIGHAARTGNLARVDELLTSIRSPDAYVAMLSLREFEPAWPAIERRAGDNLATVASENVDWTAARLADKPEDRDRLSAYAHALLFAGRYTEAASVAREWQKGREGLDEGDAWAMNIEAYALDALGRPGEADAVFDRLAALPADGIRGWSISSSTAPRGWSARSAGRKGSSRATSHARSPRSTVRSTPSC